MPAHKLTTVTKNLPARIPTKRELRPYICFRGHCPQINASLITRIYAVDGVYAHSSRRVDDTNNDTNTVRKTV